MLPFSFMSLVKYLMYHHNELIVIGIFTALYIFLRIYIYKRISKFLSNISDKKRRYLSFLGIFFSYPFLFIIFTYITIPFLKGPTDILKFLLPLFWGFVAYYIFKYLLSILGFSDKSILRNGFILIIGIFLFYYYLSKPSTSPVYWLLYPFFSIGGRKLSIINIIVGLILFYLSFYFAKTTKVLLEKRLTKDFRLEKNRVENLLVIWQYFFTTIGILLSLSFIGIRLSSLLIIAGSLGVGVGFGLQTIVNNFLSGLILLMDRSINPGDIITIGEKVGRVISIGARYTIVRTFDSHDILVPNYKFIETEVINWTRSGLDMRVHIPFSISYNSDPEKAKEIVLSIARSHPRVMAYPPPEVLFMEFGESSLNFKLFVWISDLTLGVNSLKSEFNFLIFKAFAENGIEIPYPQMDVHIKKS